MSTLVSLGQRRAAKQRERHVNQSKIDLRIPIYVRDMRVYTCTQTYAFFTLADNKAPDLPRRLKKRVALMPREITLEGNRSYAP